MERRASKSGYVTAVPATGLRGWLALRFMAYAEKKAAQQASGDLCTSCGHDALYHQARTLREHRRRACPEARASSVTTGNGGLLHPAKSKCLAFSDAG